MIRRRFLAALGGAATAVTGVGTVAGARRRRPRAVYRFGVVGRSSASPAGEIEISIGPDARVVDVTGTILGADGCAGARVGDVSFADGDLEVLVETYDPTDDPTLCTQAITGIDYEAQFVAPSTVSTAVVRHDGVDDAIERETADPIEPV